MWLDSTAPYGPVGIAAAAVAALPARHPMVFVTVLRVLIVAAILLAGAAGARLAQRCGVPPARAVLVGLVTPLVAVHGVSGAHLDTVVLALVVGGLWAASLRFSAGAAFLGVAAAGLLIGLAIAIKVSAVRAWHRRATTRAVLSCCGWAMAASFVVATPTKAPGAFAVTAIIVALTATYLGMPGLRRRPRRRPGRIARV